MSTRFPIGISSIIIGGVDSFEPAKTDGRGVAAYIYLSGADCWSIDLPNVSTKMKVALDDCIEKLKANKDGAYVVFTDHRRLRRARKLEEIVYTEMKYNVLYGGVQTSCDYVMYLGDRMIWTDY